MGKERVRLVPPDDLAGSRSMDILLAGDAAFEKSTSAALSSGEVTSIEAVRDGSDIFCRLDHGSIDCVVLPRTVNGRNAFELFEIVSHRVDLCPPFVLFAEGPAVREVTKAFRIGLADWVSDESGDSRELLHAVRRAIGRGRETRRLLAEIDYLSRLATHDRLTGLRNRVYLEERLNQVAESARRYRGRFALIAIDINEFKQINDIHGHVVGDEALRSFARKLVAASRSSDTFGRFGGDEFVYLIDRDVTGEAVELACRRLSSALTFSFDLDRIRLSLTASIGAAIFPDHGDDLDAILASADAAMYAAKSTGSGFTVYGGQPRPARGLALQDPAADRAIAPGLPAPRPADGLAGLPPGGLAAGDGAIENRRASRRMRVLKRGRIIIGDGLSTIDCVVRDVSRHGARITIDDLLFVPERFTFTFVEDGTVFVAARRWQHGRNLGLEFADDISEALGLPLDVASETAITA